MPLFQQHLNFRVLIYLVKMYNPKKSKDPPLFFKTEMFGHDENEKQC